MNDATRLQPARDLFFTHDGSHFYMSRDGTDHQYVAYAVPRTVEQQWLAELAALRLDAIDKAGNWSCIHFFIHHHDTSHLDRFVATPPLGRLWERTAYVELLLKYIAMCQKDGASNTMVENAVDVVLTRARALIRGCRSDKSRGRVNRLIASAHHHRAALPPAHAGGPGHPLESQPPSA